ncbi:hypothetical protein JK358_00475 [Nocardia sp. 2]|uniref:Uncharacterized protein n=1 Tax=Nocardia acididurans TaxID=2802282 RepID=A0ABS1M149_9NOCA|nr:hypothetical protein [Nocardia acididurans]MBL1072863.1 hypothetical protein [Nocardia acididurans]
MTDWLSMDTEGVQQQANSFQTAGDALKGVFQPWRNPKLFEAADLGAEYRVEGQSIADGFDQHVVETVNSWYRACATYESILRKCATDIQYTDANFSTEISAITVTDQGGLVLGHQPTNEG